MITILRLQSPIANFARVIKQIAEQKEHYKITSILYGEKNIDNDNSGGIEVIKGLSY